MKLLLTSNGLCNRSIVRVLKKWVKGDIEIAFIPTAAHATDRDKSWLITNLSECSALGKVYIADIAAVDKKIWLPQLKKANVIVVGGGNAQYLMKQIVSSGLKDELPELLKDKVYVGISAGSMVMGRGLYATSQYLINGEIKKAHKGLGYVDFCIRSHFNSKKHPGSDDKSLRKLLHKIKGDMYALDNQSAVVVEDGKLSVVSEGEWKLYCGTMK